MRTSPLGFFVTPGVSALVLENLLRNEALHLDWTFKASLLLDLICVRSLPGPGTAGKWGGQGDRRCSDFPQLGSFSFV